MDESRSDRFHSVGLSDSSDSDVSYIKINLPECNNTMCEVFTCCFSNKWCFNHITPAAYGNSGETHEIYCVCFDCCTWCLEFEQNTCLCCKKNSTCFMCCFTIRFK